MRQGQFGRMSYGIFAHRIGAGPERPSGFVAVALVGLVIYLLLSPSDTTSALNQTLPQTVSDFGAGARVVRIEVSDDYVRYEVIPADGLLHRRDDPIAEQGPNVEDDSTRNATATELKGAQLRLGEISGGSSTSSSAGSGTATSGRLGTTEPD